ncbi:MAG: chromosome segregation protein SMC [Oscillospiraceae bacterium]|nr:chromosome segregation protein SMC [Oscillospiraceae bacterium]
MFLKSLELQGFKTFPDKTRLSFDTGMTSVVGPNGSGKSNISDAIRWVLGEQSPKSLRCSKMEDVVFNGTDDRKPLGYAEVTLNIDNTDRFLQYDGNDVAVTRRYYRSGESEYLINGTQVRLRDVNELFMDTGLGRDGYSMIGQGKIDSIVASKSEDRREIFEEAAGISRYRYKKIESERKLKHTEDNLLRLKDIVTELGERVGPLKSQSQKAEKFLEYSAEKKDIEISLWVNTLDNSQKVLKEQEDKIEISRLQHSEADKVLSDIHSETEEIYLKNINFSSDIEEIRSNINDLIAEISSKKSSVSVAENDILHNEENIKRLENEINQVDIDAVNVSNDIDNKKENISQIESKILEKNKEYEELTEKLNGINLDSSRSGDLIQELSSKLATLTAQSADARVTQMTCSSSIYELENRINAILTQNKDREEQIKITSQMLENYKAELNKIDDLINCLNNTINGLEIKLQSRSKKRDELKEKSDKLNLDANECSRRVKLLEDLERNLEGFSYSVKTVMQGSGNGLLKGIHGPVSRVFEVPEEYNVAVEIALGAAMQHIVTETEQDAKNAIAYLKQRDKGRATFLPLNTIKARDFSEKGLDDCYGFIGIASDLCSCNPKYNNILKSLLGRIVVAEDINCATSIAKKYGYRFKIVTLDGQVVNAGGSLTGGSLGKKSGLLSRASEIAKAKKQAEGLKHKSLDAQKEYEKVVADYSSIEADVLGAKGDLANAKQEQIRLMTEAKACENELNTQKSALDNSETELSDCKNRIETLKENKVNAENSLNKITVSITECEREIEKISGSRSKLTEEREVMSEKLQNIKLEILTFEKDIETLKSEIQFALSTEESREQRKSELRAEIENYRHTIEDTKRRKESLNTDINNLNKKVDSLNSEIDSINEKKNQYEKHTAELRNLEREKTNEREVAGRELARLEERKINLQKEYDSIISKLWEEYQLTRNEATEIAVKLDDISQSQKRLNELKLKIRNLGNVNVAAIEEYKEVSERYEFMTAQVEDVEKSKKEIEKLIVELTKQMQEEFIVSFEQINRNFTYTFKELFGGGTASLSLTDPENILTSGIDIVVHPPGKIVVHLDALSGGEKALVAIALYFAIMKVRPAPFCVMDEIEAALDDVNVDRFAQYVRSLTHKTQFILITHRRGTMEEADVLYGVTMQDEGVSKLLELRASEVAAKLGI